jgi:hypothetical protein
MGICKLTEVDWFLELFEQTFLQHHLIMLGGRMAVTEKLERVWKWPWSIFRYSTSNYIDGLGEKNEKSVCIPETDPRFETLTPQI